MRVAVAFVSFHDNDLTIKVVEAPDALTAAVQCMNGKGWEIDTLKDMDELQQLAFDGDCLIAACPV